MAAIRASGVLMLRIHFTADDYVRTTLASVPDPLWEVLLSLHQLQVGDGPQVFGGWRRQTRPNVSLPLTRLLLDLAPPHGYSPDFLTPTARPATFGEALDNVLSTSRHRIRDEVAYLTSRRPATPWTRRLAAAEAGTMKSLGDALSSYHRTAVAPYWRSIRTQVAADHQFRAGQLAEHGLDRVLSSLHPRISWKRPVLEVMDFADSDVHLNGRGLRLQPSYFCWQAPTKLRNIDLPPILVHPISHPVGRLGAEEQQDDTADEDRLAALLGRSRATALSAATAGRSTSELAEVCRISVGAASHQATILRQAGLITSRRRGGSMIHQVTHLGLGLLAGGEEPGDD